MKNILKYILIVFIILLAFSGVVTVLDLAGGNIQEIPLSQLVQKINTEQVKEIIVKNDNLKITLIDGTEEKSKKEFNQVLLGYPNIDSANLEISPIWKMSIPDNSKDITVTVNNPK